MQPSMESRMDKRASKSDMNAASFDTIKDEMRACIAAAAGPPRYGDKIKTMIARAAAVLEITPRRARSLWERDAKRIDATEYLAIRERVRALQQKAEAIHERNAQTREAINRTRARLVGRGAGEAVGSPDRVGHVAREDGRGADER